MENDEFGVAPEGEVDKERIEELSKPKVPPKKEPKKELEEESEGELEEEPDTTEEEEEIEEAKTKKEVPAQPKEPMVEMPESEWNKVETQFVAMAKEIKRVREIRKKQEEEKEKNKRVPVKDSPEYPIPIQKNPFFWIPPVVLLIQLVALVISLFAGFHWGILLLLLITMLFVALFVFAGSSWMNWLYYSMFRKRNWGYMLVGEHGNWKLVFKKLPEAQKFPYQDEAGAKREEKSKILTHKFLTNLGTKFVVVKRGYSKNLDLDAIDLDGYFPEVEESKEHSQEVRMGVKAGLEAGFDEKVKQPRDAIMYVLLGITLVLVALGIYFAATSPERTAEALKPLIEGIVAAIPQPQSTITPG